MMAECARPYDFRHLHTYITFDHRSP
jgi:hypothetical protein